MSRLLVRSRSFLQPCEQHTTARYASLVSGHGPCGGHLRLVRAPFPQHTSLATQQPRAFSSNPQCLYATGRASTASTKSQATPSIALAKAKQKELAMSGEIKIDDFGLLPDTFIMPRRSRRPGWVKNFQQRWALEKTRLRIKFWDFFQ